MRCQGAAMMLRVIDTRSVRWCAGAPVRLSARPCVRLSAGVVGLLVVAALPLRAQGAGSDSTLLTLDRIFASEEFRAAPAGGMRWLPGGTVPLAIEGSAFTPDRG